MCEHAPDETTDGHLEDLLPHLGQVCAVMSHTMGQRSWIDFSCGERAGQSITSMPLSSRKCWHTPATWGWDSSAEGAQGPLQQHVVWRWVWGSNRHRCRSVQPTEGCHRATKQLSRAFTRVLPDSETSSHVLSGYLFSSVKGTGSRESDNYSRITFGRSTYRSQFKKIPVSTDITVLIHSGSNGWQVSLSVICWCLTLKTVGLMKQSCLNVWVSHPSSS